MNANLRGDVRVKGLTIEEFIKNIVIKNSTGVIELPTTKNYSIAEDIVDIIKEKMQPLEAFQDEKKIMTNELAQLVERVVKLESSPPPNVGSEPDIARSMEKLEKKVTDLETLEKKVTDLEKLEKKVTDLEKLEKKVTDLEKKVTDMKPKRGVDQNTLDTAITDVQQRMESEIQAISDALAELRKELEE